VPAAQFTQTEASEAAWYKPESQLLHTADAASEIFPAEQDAQLVLPASLWNLPALQLRQMDEPVLSW